MVLEIIGAGYARTGTMSLKVALEQLGYPCYHMSELMDKPANADHLNFWLKVARDPEGAPQDWEHLFRGYSAAIDNPAAAVWRELIAAFPEAKVILTEHPRGADAWYESALATIYDTVDPWQYRVLEATSARARRFGEMVRRLIWERSLGGTMPERVAVTARYRAHLAEVRATVPPERLLEFQVDQGWEPLCAFLGVEVPDAPFPDVNDRAAKLREVAAMNRRAYLRLAALAGLAAAALSMALLR